MLSDETEFRIKDVGEIWRTGITMKTGRDSE